MPTSDRRTRNRPEMLERLERDLWQVRRERLTVSRRDRFIPHDLPEKHLVAIHLRSRMRRACPMVVFTNG